MRKVTLGRTQIKVSSVSLGTWAFGGANMSGKFSVGWSDQSKNNSKKLKYVFKSKQTGFTAKVNELQSRRNNSMLLSSYVKRRLHTTTRAKLKEKISSNSIRKFKPL